jgi:hypothetical protein
MEYKGFKTIYTSEDMLCLKNNTRLISKTYGVINASVFIHGFIMKTCTKYVKLYGNGLPQHCIHHYVDSYHTLKITYCRALVVHTYNPSYLGSRDQEDYHLKPAQANSLQDPILKTPITNKGGKRGGGGRGEK